MIGRMMLRGIRKTTRGRKAPEREPAPSWGEINKSRAGRWAVVIFASLFVGMVLLIMLAIEYANARH